MSGRMIAVVGPSGVGKDTVTQALVDAAPQLSLVRRVITRAADAGGEDYDAASPAVLRARLTARGREDGREIDARLARAGFALPGGINAIHIDNSGPIADTVQRALRALYPQKDVTLT